MQPVPYFIFVLAKQKVMKMVVVLCVCTVHYPQVLTIELHNIKPYK